MCLCSNAFSLGQVALEVLLCVMDGIGARMLALAVGVANLGSVGSGQLKEAGADPEKINKRA